MRMEVAERDAAVGALNLGVRPVVIRTALLLSATDQETSPTGAWRRALRAQP